MFYTIWSCCRFLVVRLLTRRVLLPCAVITCIGLFFVNRMPAIEDIFQTASPIITRAEKYTGYVVETKNCRIPNIDPFDPAISTYIGVIGWEPCPGRRALTYQDGEILRLNWTVINFYHPGGNSTSGGKFNICRYYPIVRITDDTYKILKVDIPFQFDITVKHEFIKVICYDTNNKEIYTNYHAYVLHPNIVQPKLQTKVLRKTTAKLQLSKLNQTFTPTAAPKASPKAATSATHTVTTKVAPTMATTTKRTVPDVKVKLNILMVGVDSMSRLNFMRQMHRTRSYLMEELGAFDIAGYNKVADNTFVNLVPILVGRYVEDLPWDETKRRKPFDEYTFMWNRYKEYGSATMFAEDAPSMTTFNFGKAGFKKQPTDHYYRPFAIAMEEDRTVWSSECVHDRMETELVLGYAHDFARVYKDEHYFGLAFISRLTHDDINQAGRADILYKKFFEKLHTENLLKNTLVFFFSDHGIRFGKFRKTYIGKIEERLPFMLIIPPPWLNERYPNMWNNLKVNSHRLTTPFDIYETLLAALDIDTAAKVDKQITSSGQPRKKQVGYSLFTEVPYDRTCKEATILTHWCSCHKTTQTDINDRGVIRAAQAIVSKLNKMLDQEKKKCAVLKLKKIIDASIIGANDQLLRFQDSVNDVINRRVYYGKAPQVTTTDYQMTFETTPGGGHFEVTIRYQPTTNKYTLLGDISRTNVYGHQADCIDNSKLKKYCYCPQDILTKKYQEKKERHYR